MSCRSGTDRRRAWTYRLCATFLPVAILLSPSTARPEPAPEQNKAIAEQLFNQGRDAMRDGRHQEACPKLAESQRLDPAAGTLLNLAVCHELEGKIATAWAEYTELVVLAQKEQQPERERIATERARALESKLSYVILEPPAGTRPPGLVVELDGVPLGQAVLGSPLPIDPGRHVLEARAPGRATHRESFEISGEPSHRVVALPVLETVAPRAAPPATDAHERSGDSTKRLVRQLGIGGVALGVVAAGVGTYFALSANASWEERNRHCADGCDAQAVDAWERATQSAAYADAAFAFSLLSGGTGIFLLVVPLETSSENGKKARATYSPVVHVGGVF